MTCMLHYWLLLWALCSQCIYGQNEGNTVNSKWADLPILPDYRAPNITAFSDEKLLKLFKKRSETEANLNDTNLVKLIDSEECKTKPYVLMNTGETFPANETWALNTSIAVGLVNMKKPVCYWAPDVMINKNDYEPMYALIDKRWTAVAAAGLWATLQYTQVAASVGSTGCGFGLQLGWLNVEDHGRICIWLGFIASLTSAARITAGKFSYVNTAQWFQNPTAYLWNSGFARGNLPPADFFTGAYMPLRPVKRKLEEREIGSCWDVGYLDGEGSMQMCVDENKKRDVPTVVQTDLWFTDPLPSDFVWHNTLIDTSGTYRDQVATISAMIADQHIWKTCVCHWYNDQLIGAVGVVYTNWGAGDTPVGCPSYTCYQR